MSYIDRVYIHIPFCRTKCGYCAFHSIPSPEEKLIEAYLEKLEDDIKRANLTSPLKSLYLGGGTPSYLSENNLGRLFRSLKTFNFASDAEISIECNPESLTEEKIDLISDFANRISLGVQSFNTMHRQTIGRIACIENISYLITSFQKRNVNNVSCDLIYGIPNQTIEEVKDDLKRLFELGIKHFSAYSLTIEENSKLDGKLTEPELEAIDLTASEIWEIMPDLISDKGFKRYEISNYSLDGYECQHNCAIWFGAKYLGFGPAASSFDGIDRWTNPELSDYLNGKAAEVDSITHSKRVCEIFAMGLRTAFCWIIKTDIFGAEIGSSFGIILNLPLQDWKPLLNTIISLKEDGLLEVDTLHENGIVVKCSARGLAFWNDVAMSLI
ncbi:MAG: radical SAM family heme chaperone HemW [Lentisphaerota bacterium]